MKIHRQNNGLAAKLLKPALEPRKQGAFLLSPTSFSQKRYRKISK